MTLSPLGVVITSKLRIIHDLSFLHGNSKHSVNADTDFESAPQCNLGHVLRNVVWRVLYLRRRFGNAARIVLSKMDVKDAFRQVAVDAARSPVFGYLFRDLIIVDRRLQFGWRNSPGYWCLFASALEHSHRNTSFLSAVGTDQGRAATAHVVVEQPVDSARPVALHPRVVTPPGRGGGVNDDFFVEYYVDDGILVEVQHFANRGRCLTASASLASDHFHLFGERHAGDPPLLSSSKVSSWNTRLTVLGWDIDTIAMTISLPEEKLTQLHDLLAAWPAGRRFAVESELRTLIGKLLHVCG